MGCDGGTIPRRSELVRVRRKPESKDRTSHLNFQWRYCNLTQQVLQRPVVACGLGRLYNKTAVIAALISKDRPEHVRSLRDVLELKLGGGDAWPHVCPVTGLEMSGRFRFVALWSCGCVFAERVLREVGAETCPRCQRRFTGDDVLVLNPATGAEAALMAARMKSRKRLRRSSKQS